MALAWPDNGRMEIISKYCFFSFNLCVLFFQMATKLLGQIVIKLFGPNYLTTGSVRYFFWPMGTEKKMLSTIGAMNRENLGTTMLGIKYFQ